MCCTRRHPDYTGRGAETTKFVSWANASECSATEDAPGTWELRRACAQYLITAALLSGRTALLPEAMRSVYNVPHMARWYAP